MWVANAVKHIQDVLNESRRRKQGWPSKTIIPYGRHSYGPQPEIVGCSYYPFLRKARGSRIGNFSSVAEGLKFFFLEQHHYNWVSAFPFYAFYNKWKVDVSPYQNGDIDPNHVLPTPIIIENDVWIGANVMVKEGVRISNGAVVAMESFVVKDVPPYAIVGGNPAQIIKYRFSEKQIDELLRIAWWDWKDEDIKQALPLLLSSDINAFIEATKKLNSPLMVTKVKPSIELQQTGGSR